MAYDPQSLNDIIQGRLQAQATAKYLYQRRLRKGIINGALVGFLLGLLIGIIFLLKSVI